MLTPKDYEDLALELTEKQNPVLLITRKDSAKKAESTTVDTPKKISTLISNDVHKTSMEIVETVLWGGAVE